MSTTKARQRPRMHSPSVETIMMTRAGRLLADTAHDLRGPLSAASGLISLVLDDDAPALSEEQREHLHIAIARCDEMQRMIEDMLALDRMRSGLPRIIRSAVDASQLRLSVEATVARDAAQRDIRLAWRGLDAAAPRLWADADKLRRWIINLIHNSLKATEPGGRVTVYLSPIDAGQCRLGVRDTGRGIAPAAQQRLIQGTQEVRRERTTDNLGASEGLGMTICRQIAQLHHSRLWLNSEPNVGTAIEMMVPIASPSAVARTFCRWRSRAQQPQRRSDGFIALPEDPVIAKQPEISLQTLAAVSPQRSAVEDVDFLVQSDLGINEIAYRVADAGWVMAWDESTELVPARRQRIQQAIDQQMHNHSSPGCVLRWSHPGQYSVLGGDRAPAAEALIRAALTFREPLAPRETVSSMPIANPVKSVAAVEDGQLNAVDIRLHHEMRQLATHFRRRQSSLVVPAPSLPVPGLILPSSKRNPERVKE